jgi:hypothetical protein
MNKRATKRKSATENSILTVRSGTINHRDGHKINPSVGISPTFSHCDRS